MSESGAILERLRDALWDKFHIAHTTIQFEITGCETTHGCSNPPAVDAVSSHAHHHHHHGHDHSHSH
jgi:cobalt-zinc-cadmium efflux system protein